MVNPIQFSFTRHRNRQSSDNIGLIVPTSLCAGQVAGMITRRLNEQGAGQPELSRFVTLAHTEGCGTSGGPAESLFARTMIGYITHPMVEHCLLLEHGCEKTHNDYMRHQMDVMGVDASRLGYASIQLDGGIAKVSEKVEAWFADRLVAADTAEKVTVGLEGLRIGIVSVGAINKDAGKQLGALTKMIVGAEAWSSFPRTADCLPRMRSVSIYLARLKLGRLSPMGNTSAEMDSILWRLQQSMGWRRSQDSPPQVWN